jgi:hypothetical protein
LVTPVGVRFEAEHRHLRLTNDEHMSYQRTLIAATVGDAPGRFVIFRTSPARAEPYGF